MQEQHVHQHFIDSADLRYQWADVLARPIAQATQALLACVTGGSKVLTGGNGACGALAQYVVALLVGGLARERPALPALALGTDLATFTALGSHGDCNDSLAAQVRALGVAGDVLLTLATDGRAASLLRAVDAAHERDMSVVALTGQDDGELGQRLRDTDIHVSVPSTDTVHILEAHQMVLHCVCEGLDRQLLGDKENPA